MTVTAPTTGTLPEVGAPYPGLTFFTEEDADYFFGRDSDGSVIVGNLGGSRWTLLYAQSGVGKSSVLRAGVAARIREQAARDVADGRQPRFVGAVFSTWTEEPVAGVVAAICDAAAPFAEEALDLSGCGLEEAVEAVTTSLGTTLLLILDQFEEYFLYHTDDAGGETFADQLARCVNRPDLRVNVLISIREDMYAGLGELFRGRIAHVYDNFLHLDYLDEQCARQAIVRPIELLQQSHPEVGIEGNLVDAVLEGVRLQAGPQAVNGQSGSGPLQIETAYLQLVMRRLWDEEETAGSPVLRLATLERLGGTQEIIEGHLHGALSELSPQEQDVAAAAFRFLVTRAGTKIAWTTKDLAEVSDVPESDLDPVLKKLAAPKLKILRPAALREGADGASYEIFHDALARPIIRWRQEHALARERIAKEEAERKTAEAEEREAQERRRKRGALIALGVALAAIAVGVVVFVRGQQSKANERLKANESVGIADRVSGSTLAPGPAALADLEAERLSPTFDARSGMLGALQENAALPTILAGHTRSALAVAFAPGGSGRIASGGADGSLRIWSRDGRELRTFYDDSGEIVASVAYSAQGMVAVGQGDGSVYLWLPSTGGPYRKLSGPSGGECGTVPCTPIAFSPSGRLLATSDEAGRVRIWNTARLGKPVLSVEEPGVVHALAFSSDGARLVAAEDGGVVVWSVSPAGQISGRTVLTPRSALAVAAAADGRIAAGVGHDAFVWSPNGRLYRRFTAPDVVAAVAFLDDGARVAYGGYDDNVTERDVASGDELGAPRSHGGDVNAIAVSPDGKTIASASDDGYVKLWRADAAGSLASVSLGNVGMTNLGIGAGGLVAAASREHGPVRIWTPRPVGTAGSASPRVTTLSGYDAPLAVYGASPAVHDSLMAAANDPKPAAFALWDIGSSCAQMPQTPCRVATVPDAGDTLYSMAFSKSGGTLATGTVSNLALWDVSPPAHPSLLARTGTIGQVNAVAFDPTDDSFLAAVSADGDVRLLRRSGHRLGVTVLRRSAQGNPEYALAFSPDGKLLAAAGWGQTISLWNMKDPAHPRPIFWPVSQSNSILSLAFSPDGRYLVAGDGDGSACVYDISSLRAIGSGRCLTGSNGGDPNSIDALAFERDGSALLASGRGQPVVAWSSVLWGAGGDAAVAGAVCRLAGRNLTAGQWSFAFTGTKLAGHMHRTCP